MSEVEYMVVKGGPLSIERLNALGKEGWLLCGVESHLVVRYIFAKVKVKVFVAESHPR